MRVREVPLEITDCSQPCPILITSPRLRNRGDLPRSRAGLRAESREVHVSPISGGESSIFFPSAPCPPGTEFTVRCAVGCGPCFDNVADLLAGW